MVVATSTAPNVYADKSFVLFVYDISNDRRRTRLHNALLNFGTPVQYSVFECLVNKNEIERMRKSIQKLIHPRIDQVCINFLYADCVAKTEATAGKEIFRNLPGGYVVGGENTS